jgi:hypothetical protein
MNLGSLSSYPTRPLKFSGPVQPTETKYQVNPSHPQTVTPPVTYGQLTFSGKNDDDLKPRKSENIWEILQKWRLSEIGKNNGTNPKLPNTEDTPEEWRLSEAGENNASIWDMLQENPEKKLENEMERQSPTPILTSPPNMMTTSTTPTRKPPTAPLKMREKQRKKVGNNSTPIPTAPPKKQKQRGNNSTPMPTGPRRIRDVEKLIKDLEKELPKIHTEEHADNVSNLLFRKRQELANLMLGHK